MDDAHDHRIEILTCLSNHFSRSLDYLTPEQVSEMTAIDVSRVQLCLAMLFERSEITGMEVAEVRWPLYVTGVRYAAA
jgi:hypothetical protein